jgi:hypothetical protein
MRRFVVRLLSSRLKWLDMRLVFCRLIRSRSVVRKVRYTEVNEVVRAHDIYYMFRSAG